ncbi:BZ3500_MvSof-1268-A1-R1_Chr2-3g05251 [Microbotryum saponariae]|uniref:BZ3500_MvSof-1268-A1-R1_Chr2-3g05251 protein n=1 Tax=Microbotryum saponariae TaxID=289078 RepID=A0A2X0KXG4_9BASI|nr:BZ3500_MvSof-1268-A1-R1_Chr2-3g05251 [Microbotryum saponariae]SDA01077.1 BZ3501_MvSof-1269-A2-R1_Chr2-2g04924 [Microbotryum saponariae]
MTSFLSTEQLPSPPFTSGLPTLEPIRSDMSVPLSATVSPTVMKTPVIREFNPDAASDDDEDDDSRPSKKTKRAGMDDDDGGEKGRRKIEIEYITKKEKRHITFSKRKAGIMKKAYELATLTGTQVLLLVVSETGIVYTFTTSKFQPLVGAAENGNPSEGQRLIQQCLAVTPEDGSDYISPPPDGPLLPLPPSAHKRPFEANSSIHGGQIALRTRVHRPSGRSKGRPSAILTGAPETLPDSSGMNLAIAEQQSSGLPAPPHTPQRLHPLQRSPGIHGEYTSPALPSSDRPEGTMQSSQDYAYMMQRNMSPGRLPNMSPEGHTVYPPHHPHNYSAEYGMHPQQHPGMQQHHSQQQHPHHMSPEHGHPHSQHYQRSPGPSPHLQHAGIPTEPPMGMYEQPSVLMQPHSQHPHHSPQRRGPGPELYHQGGGYEEGTYMQERR